jgi:hypothetical protein
MADARALLVPMALVLAGCEAEESTLLLDRLCNQTTSFDPFTGQQIGSPCELSGDVFFTTAVSEDTVGLRFGPSGGKLTIHLLGLSAAARNRWTLDALASSTQPEGSAIFRSLTWGSCGPSCPADPGDVEAPLDESFVWVTLVDDQPGSNGQPIPGDAILVLRGKSFDLVDLRAPGVPQGVGVIE